MERFKIIEKENIDTLPKTAGVYLFLAGSQAIYIGKAANIKSRVKNHFSQPSYRDNLFMGKVDKIGFFETGSEIEALILEAQLIKKYQPKYNVVWKDDKNYFWVAVENNKDGVPFVYITHQTTKLEARNSKLKTNSNPKIKNTKHVSNFDIRISDFPAGLIGPFVEGTALKKTLRLLRKAFPYYTLPRHPKLKCAYCHLDLCPGPEPDLKFYKKNIKKLVLILQGKKNSVLNSLKKDMKIAGKEKKFEEAAKIRDQIYALGHIMSHAHILENAKSQNPMQTKIADRQFLCGLDGRVECYDVSNIQGKFATGSMVVFTNGKPDKSQYRKFKIKMGNEPNDIAMLKETLSRRFKHTEWPLPNIILMDGGRAQLNAAISVIHDSSVIPGRDPGSRARARTLDSGFRQNDIVVMALAKGKQELWTEGQDKPIPLKDLPRETFNLIKNLDDEAHRFAISYHKKLRKKDLID